MKKILLAATFMMVSTLVGMAQSTEKVLKMGKWYADAELGSKSITLKKIAPAKYEFDMELISDVVMSCGKIAKADFISNEGGQVKAGTYYTETGYSYKITGNTILITSQPLSWSYNVISLKNGDLLLETTSSSTNKNSSTK